jgi:hypothetical protein
MGGSKLQCTEASFPLNSHFPASLNSPFQDLTHLRGGSKTAGGKESFSSSYKDVLSRATPW